MYIFWRVTNAGVIQRTDQPGWNPIYLCIYISRQKILVSGCVVAFVVEQRGREAVKYVCTYVIELTE